MGFQGCFKNILRKMQGCSKVQRRSKGFKAAFKVVLMVKRVSKVLPGQFQGYLRKFSFKKVYKCFHGVLGKLHGYGYGVFEGSLKGVSRVFQESLFCILVVLWRHHSFPS